MRTSVILLFLIVSFENQVLGQVFEKIYPNPNAGIIQISDSSILCRAGDTIFNIDEFTGDLKWVKFISGCSATIIKGKQNDNFSLGLANCSFPGSGPFPDIVVQGVSNGGDTIWQRTLGKSANHPIGVYNNDRLYVGYFSGQSFLYSLDSSGGLLDSITFVGGKAIRGLSHHGQEIIVAFNNLSADSAEIIELNKNLTSIKNIYIDSVESMISTIKVIDSTYFVLAGRQLFQVNPKTGNETILAQADSTYYFDFDIINDTLIVLVGHHLIQQNVEVTLFDIKNKIFLKSKCFGSFGYVEYGYKIIKTHEGDLVVSGNTKFNENEYRGYIFRLNKNLDSNSCSDSLGIIKSAEKICIGGEITLINNSFGIDKLYTWIIAGDTFKNKTVEDQLTVTADSLGFMEVKLISCSDTLTTSVTVVDTALPAYNFIRYGDSVVFFAPMGYGNLVYNWDFGDGSSSQDSLAYNVYADSGIYSVTLTLHNGSCFIYQSDTISISSTTGVKEVSQNSINIFPNPSQDGTFFLSYGHFQNLLIYDSKGRQVQYIYSNSTLTLQTAAPGIYYAFFSTATGSFFVKKLVVL